jgi:hypothetical protein
MILVVSPTTTTIYYLLSTTTTKVEMYLLSFVGAGRIADHVTGLILPVIRERRWTLALLDFLFFFVLVSLNKESPKIAIVEVCISVVERVASLIIRGRARLPSDSLTARRKYTYLRGAKFL